MSSYCNPTGNAYVDLALKKGDYAATQAKQEAYNPSYVTNNNSIFTTNQTTTPTNVNTVSDVPLDPECTDGADDGKLGFGETLGSFFKGVISPITSMFESPENFIKGAAMVVGGGLLIAATGGAAAPLLVAAGVTMGGIQVVKGISGAANAKTDAEAKAAWEEIGCGTGAVAGSVIGAKAAVKAAGIEGASEMSSLQATKACFTNAGSCAKNSLGAFTSGAWKTNLGIGKNSAKTEDTPETGEKTPTKEKTAQDLYDEGAPDEQVIEQAKKERLSHKDDKALTPENSDSPQKKIYEEVDQIDTDNPDYNVHNKQRNKTVAEKMVSESSLEDQIQFAEKRLAEAQKEGYSGSIKAAKDRLKMLKEEYKNTTGKEYSASPADTAATPTAAEVKLTNKETRTYNNLKKLNNVEEIAAELEKNETVWSDNLQTKVNELISEKGGTAVQKEWSNINANIETPNTPSGNSTDSFTGSLEDFKEWYQNNREAFSDTSADVGTNNVVNKTPGASTPSTSNGKVSKTSSTSTESKTPGTSGSRVSNSTSRIDAFNKKFGTDHKAPQKTSTVPSNGPKQVKGNSNSQGDIYELVNAMLADEQNSVA